jgi:3-phosphoshikimate 1-carboxyvinyltransferase
LAAKQHIPIIQLPGSKSISNRLLMIKTIGNLSVDILNLSDSDDTKLLIQALHDIKAGRQEINIGHAGTNMRFLCSYLSCLPGQTFVLTGSERMKQRPIKELVKALKQIGADITYVEKEGYPPLKINGKNLEASEIEIKADISSQYVSSLLLIAPLCTNGCMIKLNGPIVSSSYIKMTLELMHAFSIKINWTANSIEVKPGAYKEKNSAHLNESDWSAAGYFYSGLLLSKYDQLELNGLKKSTVQPDSKLTELFAAFGIATEFSDSKAILTRTKKLPAHFSFNFLECPDIAQTMAVLCAAFKITADLAGLKTLKIKETDRISALKNELQKFGAIVETTDRSLHIKGYDPVNANADILVNTYDDHRMAMSFAPLKFLFPNMMIENKEVVSKSFPAFWEQFSKIS